MGWGAARLDLQILSVDPAYQRQGVAKLLLQWGIAKAKEEGLDIYLDATTGSFFFFSPGTRLSKRRLTGFLGGDSRAEGIPVYEKYGFVPVGEKLRPIDGSFEVRFLVSGTGMCWIGS